MTPSVKENAKIIFSYENHLNRFARKRQKRIVGSIPSSRTILRFRLRRGFEEHVGWASQRGSQFMALPRGRIGR
jgi:hypothetical protein